MRHHEDEPALIVLERLRNNPPVPPSTDPRMAPDLDYPRRKEAWDRAVEREEGRAKIEAEGGDHKKQAAAPGTGWDRPFLHGAKAGGPEVPSAEEQEKTRKLRVQADAQTRELEKLAKRKTKNRKKAIRRKKR